MQEDHLKQDDHRPDPDAPVPAAPATPPPEPETRITADFRNGSVTAIGIILGFSLGYLRQWASNPIDWSLIDIVAAVPLLAGIALQAKAFADLLAVEVLILARYNRAKTTFLTGLSLVAVGIAIAMVLDVFGLGPRPISN
jgi:hypothetical protein